MNLLLLYRTDNKDVEAARELPKAAHRPQRGRCDAEHAPESAAHVGGVGESGGMGRVAE